MEEEDKALLDAFRAQSWMMTQAELIALLAHDLTHKTIRVSECVEDLIRATEKALIERASPHFVERQAIEAKNACRELEHQIAQIRGIRHSVQREARFDLISCIKDVIDSFEPTLHRANMSINIENLHNVNLFGDVTILQQVFINLILNSFNAQRATPSRRKNTIHISSKHSERSSGRINIVFWDEGPGISRNAFPDASLIFQIGTTTRANGTGTGLPVSRLLLSRYFRGDLALKERNGAVFELSLPVAP
jgi:signal transduction histidine kinase